MGQACASQVRDCRVLQVAGQAEDVVGQRQRGKGAPEDRKECEIIGKLTKPSAKITARRREIAFKNRKGSQDSTAHKHHHESDGSGLIGKPTGNQTNHAVLEGGVADQ